MEPAVIEAIRRAFATENPDDAVRILREAGLNDAQIHNVMNAWHSPRQRMLWLRALSDGVDIHERRGLRRLLYEGVIDFRVATRKRDKAKAFAKVVAGVSANTMSTLRRLAPYTLHSTLSLLRGDWRGVYRSVATGYRATRQYASPTPHSSMRGAMDEEAEAELQPAEIQPAPHYVA